MPPPERFMNWNHLLDIVIPSALSAVVAWLYSSTKKVSKSDLRDSTDRLETDLEAIRLQLKEYATKTELQVQLAAIHQSLTDLRELIRSALDKKL